jgi:glutamate 5-kinase
MGTKLRMAQETAKAGIKVYLGHGRKPGLITGLIKGKWEGTIIT